VKVVGILTSLPSKQLPLPDLAATLQREFNCSGNCIYQCIHQLECLEQIDIPGIPTKMCRLKRSEKALALAEVPTARMPVLQKETPGPAPVPSIPPPLMRTPVPTPVQVVPPMPPQTAPPSVVKPQEAQPPLLVQKVEQKQQQTSSATGSANVINAPQTSSAAGSPNMIRTPIASAVSKGEKTAVKVFFCYAHEDKNLLGQLDKHLSPLKRLGQIISWHDREIQGGTEWEIEIEKQLMTANIILLLISPDFISSDYCYSVEMKKALEMHQNGQARVVPIVLRPVDWKSTPLKNLQILPTGGKPITLWPNRDQAFTDVAQGIRRIVETLLAPSRSSKGQNQ